MSTYWTRPQPVEAVQWTPALGILPGTTGVGCHLCGPGMTGTSYQGAPQTCLSIAAHDPFRHPHHLQVSVGSETVALFAGWWLVTYQDGTREVCAPDVFAQRFTSVNLENELAQVQEAMESAFVEGWTAGRE